MASYKILRFFQDDRDTEIIKTGLTLDEAQEHCTDESSHGEGWFDGYTVQDDDYDREADYWKYSGRGD